MNAGARTVLIVDDEAPARERLRRLVHELPDWTVAEVCGSGHDALRLVESLRPSAVLLDIRMPGMGGIEAARHLCSLPDPPAVVFTTAYDQYAMDAFDAKAIGYLLKPVRLERLADALDRAARLASPELGQLGSAERPLAERKHVAVRVRDELVLIRVRDILYFRAEQKYVTVRHDGGEHLIEESLKSLEDEFASQFVRIHRSVLVSVARTAALEKGADGAHCVRLRGVEESLPVSRRQLSELKARLSAGR